MQLHRSNRAEALVDALARVVSADGGDPFEAECIVVQGRGIERWLSLELSARLGVFAHARFPFPRAFLEEALVAGVGASADAGAAWEPEGLAWAIADALPARLEAPDFTPIATYLRGERGDDKLIALAGRIAETFDHYAVYRPEMVLAWERGDDEATRRWSGVADAWQAVLWRDLVARLGAAHVAARVRGLVEVLEAGAEVGPGLPRRACVFGLSTLPPLYVSALSALSTRIELHAFVLSPSREYWGWIRSERETLRLRRREAESGSVDPADLHLEEGHPLLASLGRVGRDFQEILEERTDYHESEADLYLDPTDAEPGAPTLLHTLQSDVLALRLRGGPSPTAPPVVLGRGDASISIHACHGPMREAEVLHDRLLDLFENDPGLEPHDVVVMAPDVALYAPFVEAAFAPEGDGGPAIPVRVADRGARAAFPLVEAFARVLDTLDGRLSAGEVLELIATDSVRARFGISADDEALQRAWIDASGIRWGIDAEHRAREGQPPALENTWRFGLDRLFVGMAIEDAPGRMFAEVVPQSGVEGSEAAALGRLAELTDVLFSLHARAREARPVAAWGELFVEALDRMIAVDGDRAHERQLIVDAIVGVVTAAERGGHSGPVGLSSAREAVARAFDRATTTGGFVTGAVTVCEMLPMRSIPFRVVALLGMNDDAFPRSRPRPGFDLIGARRRPGDRSARDDDRQMFLEALLSAREHLLITYVGRDIRDNESKPPSVVVDELLDHVARTAEPEADDVQGREGFGEDPASWARQRLVVVHPLQPWSPSYFADGGPGASLFSYSPAWAAAARAVAGPGAQPPPFVAAPLAARLDAEGDVSLDALRSFFANPSRYLVREVLGLRLEEAEEAGPEREPLDVEGLEAFHLGTEMLELAVAGADPVTTLRRFIGQGRLPLGEAGRAAHAELVAQVADIAKRVAETREGDGPPALDAVIACRSGRVVGRLDELFPGGRVTHRFAKLGRGSELDAWISHLALCVLAPDGVRVESHVVGRAGSRDKGHVVFGPVADAAERLADLVEIFRVGCTRPLPLFPAASRKYADGVKKDEADPSLHDKALLDAYAVFGESEPERPESQNAYVQQLFADVDPLADRYRPTGLADDERFGFRALALRVYAPLFAHREAPQ